MAVSIQKEGLVHEAEVDREIKDHPKWCGPNCDGFLPDEYRKARRSMAAEDVQKDYDLHHIWR